ncbi:hypothetical protein M514_02866 [Trichuris suis]|uniref:Uncharacterized protein n=1 Tax=Trichuris suis TaxID=68888 RepID=A0A085NAX1_9BILA|nr:hypothetical protein M513_02866 [Trichuris suis]KFD66617.1 hypothetical protein M514_02866 [Trichuris suis]
MILTPSVMPWNPVNRMFITSSRDFYQSSSKHKYSLHKLKLLLGWVHGKESSLLTTQHEFHLVLCVRSSTGAVKPIPRSNWHTRAHVDCSFLQTLSTKLRTVLHPFAAARIGQKERTPERK